MAARWQRSGLANAPSMAAISLNEPVIGWMPAQVSDLSPLKGLVAGLQTVTVDDELTRDFYSAPHRKRQHAMRNVIWRPSIPFLARFLGPGKEGGKDRGPWTIIGRLFREAWREFLPGYLVAAFFMLLVAGSTALFAWVVGDVFNKVLLNANPDRLLLLAGGVFLIFVVRGISRYGTDVTLAWIGNRLTAKLQKRVYEHVLYLGLPYFDRMHSSLLITGLSRRASSASSVVNTVLTSLVRDLFTLVGLVGVMVLKSPWLSILVVVIGPAATVGVGRLKRRIRELARAEYAGMARIIAGMQETAAGIRVLKAFNLEGAMKARMATSIEGTQQRKNRIATVKAATSPLMETLGGLAVAGVIVVAGYSAIYEGTDAGSFASFITAILLAYEPAKRLANTRVGLERDVIGVRFVYEILDTEMSVDPNPDGPDLKVTEGDIRFEKVDFGYREKTPVLKQFDFQAAPGKVTALVGPSGSGKSTIMNLIERFYDISGGKITIDGKDISDVRLASLRDQVALVSQHTSIFRDTIRENIRLGRPGATDEEVEQAAKDALAYDFIMATPRGFDTRLEEGQGLLSGGQLQRLAIARAMIRNAAIILLDEATSSLDSESEHQVQKAFDRLMAGRTTIVIAHRLSTVLGADKICVLAKGKIVESGRHAELLANDRRYARLYRLQFSQSDEIEDSSREDVIPFGDNDSVKEPGITERSIH